MAEVAYPLRINPKQPFPSEAEARDDAIARAYADVEDLCRVLDGQRMLSGRAEPRAWDRCGFDGRVVCRVQHRVVSHHERCRGATQ